MDLSKCNHEFVKQEFRECSDYFSCFSCLQLIDRSKNSKQLLDGVINIDKEINKEKEHVAIRNRVMKPHRLTVDKMDDYELMKLGDCIDFVQELRKKYIGIDDLVSEIEQNTYEREFDLETGAASEWKEI